MKKYRLAFFATCFYAFLMSANVVLAQEILPLGDMYRGVWKVRPLQFGEVVVSYENVKERDQTNEISIGYIYKSFVEATDKDRNTLTGFYSAFVDDDKYMASDANGIVLRMGQRNYTSIKKDAPAGFYHGPYFTYRFIAFEGHLLEEADDVAAIGRMYQHTLALHYQLGYQVVLAKHFTLDLFAGAGVRGKYAHAQISKGRTEDRIIGVYKIAPSDNSTFAAGPSLHLNFSVGYAFHSKRPR